MTVKEIFALRKQGKIEDAYEAIRPMYAAHKGKYTTLCMFWVASDVFKLRLEQKRGDEAEKIYRALERLLPFVEAYEQAAEHEQTQPEAKKHSAANFMHYAEGRLIHASEKFRKRYFAIRDKKKHEKSETLIPTNEPLINGKLTDNSCQFALTEKDNPFNSCNPCSPSLNSGQQAVLDCIKAHPGLRVPGIESETGIPAKSIERHIKVLIERNLIEHRGSKKTGGYHVLDSTSGRLLP